MDNGKKEAARELNDAVLEKVSGGIGGQTEDGGHYIIKYYCEKCGQYVWPVPVIGDGGMFIEKCPTQDPITKIECGNTNFKMELEYETLSLALGLEIENHR